MATSSVVQMRQAGLRDAQPCLQGSSRPLGLQRFRLLAAASAHSARARAEARQRLQDLFAGIGLGAFAPAATAAAASTAVRRRRQAGQRLISLAQTSPPSHYKLVGEHKLVTSAEKPSETKLPPRPAALGPISNAAAKLMSVVAMLRRQGQEAESRAEIAEQDRDRARATIQEQRAAIASLKSVVNAVTRYAKEVEGERDAARDALAKMAAAARREEAVAPAPYFEDANVITASEPSAAELEPSVPVPPLAMDLEAVRRECAQRGLSVDGGLALLRTRVRAARAKEANRCSE